LEHRGGDSDTERPPALHILANRFLPCFPSFRERGRAGAEKLQKRVKKNKITRKDG